MQLTNTLKKERFYFLDWLRVIAFSILLLEHSAEVFTNWKFAIKNSETSTGLGVLVMFFLPWRMPLLFVISGAAIYLSFRSRTFTRIIKERSTRLLLPLVVAMFIIIPPQIYYIRLGNGGSEGFVDFYKNVFQLQWFPKGNLHWLHLWYLAFVFAFTLMILPVLHLFKLEKWSFLLENVSKVLSKPIVFFTSGILLTLPYYVVQELSLGKNVAQLALFFPFFVFGALFFLNQNILYSFRVYANKSLVLGVITTLVLYYISFTHDFKSGPFHLLKSSKQELSLFLLQTYNLWFWLIAFFGLGVRYLNKGSKALSYATNAVYPFYILHQTVIVIIAYYVVQWEASIGIKLGLIIADSFILIIFVYEYIIRKNAITCLLFGLKPPVRPNSLPVSVSSSEHSYVAPALAVAEEKKSPAIDNNGLAAG